MAVARERPPAIHSGSLMVHVALALSIMLVAVKRVECASAAKERKRAVTFGEPEQAHSARSDSYISPGVLSLLAMV